MDFELGLGRRYRWSQVGRQLAALKLDDGRHASDPRRHSQGHRGHVEPTFRRDKDFVACAKMEAVEGQPISERHTDVVRLPENLAATSDRGLVEIATARATG